MKIYPYQTPEGVIELVEKRECDIASHRERLWQKTSEAQGLALDELRASNAELIQRLADARESHLHASARDVQTIQRQSVLLERMATALIEISAHDGPGFPYGTCGNIAFAALAAYESANLEPVANPIDEALLRKEALSILH